jgi:hypothetical protein
MAAVLILTMGAKIGSNGAESFDGDEDDAEMIAA